MGTESESSEECREIFDGSLRGILIEFIQILFIVFDRKLCLKVVEDMFIFDSIDDDLHDKSNGLDLNKLNCKYKKALLK